jgi:DNA primase
MIDQETIDKIFDAIDIVEVIGEFVNLKRAGTNFKGLSPFHDEKTPSFVVSPSKGIYKDFSSGKGGNAVGFLMEHEKFSYPEALKYLASKYSIEIKEDKEVSAEEIQKRNTRESLLIVSEFAGKYFNNNLFHHAEGKSVGYSYFKERGFNDDTINKFQLGYCPDGRDVFTSYALDNGYKLEYLVSTGLTIDKESYRFDRFSGRVMFPIHGLSGKVLGFGGRTLKADKKVAKYLNSPESEIYHKSNILYGLYFAKNSIIKHERCFLVEGYTDVLSMFQRGIENVVASSGTALTKEQIKLIKRFTKNVTVIYDGDAAGIKASLRGIDLILEEGLNVKVVLLPDGEDPDSFAKSHTADELIDYVDNNQSDFIQFKTKLLLKDSEGDPVKRAQMINDILKSVSYIPDAIVRSVYIKECSSMLDIGEQSLYTQLNKLLVSKSGEQQRQNRYQKYEQQRQQPKIERTSSVETKQDRLEKEIISLLFKFGHIVFEEYKDEDDNSVAISVADFIISELEEDDIDFGNEAYRYILNEYKTNMASGREEIEKLFVNHNIKAVQSIAADLYTAKYELSNIWTKKDSFIETEEDKLKDIVPQTVLAYKTYIVMEAIKDTRTGIIEAQKEDNYERIKELSEQIIVLNNIKQRLTEGRGKIAILR